MKKLLLFAAILLSKLSFGQSISILPTTPVAVYKNETFNVDFTTSGNVVAPFTVKLIKVRTQRLISGSTQCNYLLQTTTSTIQSIVSQNLSSTIQIPINEHTGEKLSTNSYCSASNSNVTIGNNDRYFLSVESGSIISPLKEVEINNISSSLISKMTINGQSFCSGQSISLGFSNSGLSASYPLTFSLKRLNGSTPATISTSQLNINTATNLVFPIPNNAPNDNDYYFEVSSPDISAFSTPKNIQIGFVSSLDLTSNSNCLGDDFTINSNYTDLNYIYIWDKDGVDITNTNISSVPYLYKKNNSISTDAGVYTLLVRNGVCENSSSPYTKNFTVTPPPTANSTIIVSGNTATLTASGCSASKTDWYDGNSVVAAGTLTFTTPALTKPKTYDVLCDATCPSSKTLVTVSINSTNAPTTPTLTRSAASVCSGNTMTLSATCTGGTVKWYASATSTIVLSSSNSFLPNTVSEKDITPTYYADCRVNNITSVNRSSISFDIDGETTPNVGNVTINSGSTVTLNAGCGGSIAKWYNENTSPFSPIHTGSTFMTPALTANEDYYVTCTRNSCESPSDEIIITVNPNLTPPSLDASVDYICGTGTSTITASGCSNGIVKWYINSTTIDVLTTAFTYTTPILSNVGTNTYYATCTIGANVSSRSNVPIKVYADDAIPTVTGNTTINEGSSTVLTTVCGQNQTAKWYDSPSSSNVLSSNSIFTTPNLVSNTSYYVSCGTFFSGNYYCVSTRKVVNITVTPICDVPIAYNNVLTSGNSTTLNASNCDTGTLKWYTLAGTTYTLVYSGNSYLTPLLTSNTSYYVACAKSGCESAKKQLTVEILCSTLPTLASSTVTVPNGTSAALKANGCPSTINWRSEIGGTTLAVSANNAPFTTPNLTQSPTYYYASCNNNSCGNYSNTNVLVTVNLSCNPPQAPAADGGLFAENVIGLLTASGCNGLFKWYSSLTATTALQSSLNNTYTTTPLPVGSTVYYVSCFEGCESTRTPINLTILPTLKTNNTWKTVAIPPTNEDWLTLGFDDSSWSQALENGNFCYTGGGKQIYTFGQPTKMYFRKKFYVSFIPQPSNFRIKVDEDVKVYINGTGVFSDVQDCFAYDDNTNFINVTNFLVIGENIITVEVTRCGANGSLCIISNIPTTECNANITGITSNSPISSGGSATMTASGCSGTYRWYNQATGGNIVHTSQSYTVNSITVNTTYFVSCFSTASNCESPRISKNIIVNLGGNNDGCLQAITLQSTTDDYSIGTTLKKTNETIVAKNKISSSANVTYRSNKSITLDPGTEQNPGFRADWGVVFKAEIGGCN